MHAINWGIWVKKGGWWWCMRTERRKERKFLLPWNWLNPLSFGWYWLWETLSAQSAGATSWPGFAFVIKKTVFESYSASRHAKYREKNKKNLQHIQVVATSFPKAEDDFIRGKTTISAAVVGKRANQRQEKQTMTLMPRGYNVTHSIGIISFRWYDWQVPPAPYALMH